MENVLLARVDDRLIHGQVMTAWMKLLPAKEIIVIDNKELYHCGASLKDLGKKCFAISKIEDIEYIEKISCVEEVKTQ